METWLQGIESPMQTRLYWLMDQDLAGVRPASGFNDVSSALHLALFSESVSSSHSCGVSSSGLWVQHFSWDSRVGQLGQVKILQAVVILGNGSEFHLLAGKFSGASTIPKGPSICAKDSVDGQRNSSRRNLIPFVIPASAQAHLLPPLPP